MLTISATSYQTQDVCLTLGNLLLNRGQRKRFQETTKSLQENYINLMFLWELSETLEEWGTKKSVINQAAFSKNLFLVVFLGSCLRKVNAGCCWRRTKNDAVDLSREKKFKKVLEKRVKLPANISNQNV